MAVRVHFKSDMGKFIRTQDRRLDAAMLTMATDVDRQAKILAPKDTRALVNSGKITRTGFAEYEVSFGDGRVPYARRRHFENKRNPHTLKYLERAGRNVVRDLNRYVKDLV